LGKKLSRTLQELNEEIFRGISVSEGVAIGRVLRLHHGTQHIYRAMLDDSQVEREVRRFRAAIRLAKRQLLAIKERAEKALGASHAYIFDAHLLMLEDRQVLEEIESHIKSERVNAEWAIKIVTDRLLAIYAEIKDDYLRERGSDIEDVSQRILVALSGEQVEYSRLNEDAVVVAEELLPSTAAELDLEHVRAIVTDAGGWTSHTAIIARGLGIPAIVGLRDLYKRVRTGDSILVDAFGSKVVLHPGPETVAKYKDANRRKESVQPGIAERGPARTTDGVEVYLRANVELPVEYKRLKLYGACGIGLFRSEFIISNKGHIPSEEEQLKVYEGVANVACEDGAAIRLFDLGGDKTAFVASETELNPALGLRGIRYCLRHEKVLRTQVRAILRAASLHPLDIVLPMVSDIVDVRHSRRIIDEERANLERDGIRVGSVRVGAMIEVPSAVLTASSLAKEVDFFSLGTNDLVQYMLAVDRNNGEVAPWFRSLHPAILLSIDSTLKAAKSASIPLVICGEMAATVEYSIVLVGLGATDLSMTASSIPRVRSVLSQISAAEASRIARTCLGFDTADEAEHYVKEQLSTLYPKLFKSIN
jgi:phosphoenolpyruvate-protein phosphotransferase (PTS system enzyme I)